MLSMIGGIVNRNHSYLPDIGQLSANSHLQAGGPIPNLAQRGGAPDFDVEYPRLVRRHHRYNRFIPRHDRGSPRRLR